MTSSQNNPRLERIRNSARYGRLRSRTPRYAFVLCIVVLSAAGLRTILSPGATAGSGVAPRAGEDFAAESYASEFARAYLTFSAGHPGAREAALAPFDATGLELGAGFTPPGSGSQRVEWADVAQVQHPLLGGLAITVAVKLSTALQPVYLSVPVGRGRGGAIHLQGYPSFVGPPLAAPTAELDQGREAVGDGEINRVVARALTNYLAGDGENLAADLAEAATVTLPTNRLKLSALEELNWVGAAGSGAVLAILSAVDPRGGHYRLRYEVGIQRVLGADPRIAPGWRVTYIQAISQEP